MMSIFNKQQQQQVRINIYIETDKLATEYLYLGC